MPAATVMRPRNSYIVGPVYDAVFIIFAPLIAVAFWFAVAHAWMPVPMPGHYGLDQQKTFWTFIVFAIFTEGHLVLAFFRSHANARVFSQFPVRFTLVPILVFVAAVSSSFAMLSLAVLAVWWDVYHSAMQTFGFSRIYDVKAGNSAHMGRRLDFWLSIVIYAGPIFAGAALMAHLQPFEHFKLLHVLFLSEVPVRVGSHLALVNRVAAVLSAAYLAYYAFAMRRLISQGYAVSPQKVVLLVTTAAVSVYAWYFSSFGGAFVIANLFHALQYYAFIYAQERGNLARILRLESSPMAAVIVIAVIITVGVNYGFFAAGAERSVEAASRWPWALAVTVALMHFWYDGFMWSVRKKQVGA